MSVVRRGPAAALAVGAALLLLLLARLPPPAARPRQPRPAPTALQLQPVLPRLQQEASPPPAQSQPPRTEEALKQTSDANPAVSAVSVVNESSAKPKGPRVVYTKELYMGGHSVSHPELCPALGLEIRLVVLVTSAPAHREARDGVRFTWGHYAKRSDVVLAFVLGEPPASLAGAIAEEDALYGDLIIGRSVDSYSNLTLKSLSLLEWVDTYCPRARWLLKTDDDMFINVPKLLSFISAPARANASKTIWGKVLKKSLPKRTRKSKYFLSPVQFPGRVLPAFCTGPAYLLAADAVPALLRAAPPQPYVCLEDVFVTGVLAELAHIARKHAPEFYNKKVSPHPCAVQRGVAIHMVRYHEQFDLWRKLLDGRTKCS